MSKILITSLGMGVRKDNCYQIARYQLEGKIYEESFIVRALYRHYQFDRIFMIGTKRSIWDGVYEAFAKNTAFYDENVQFELYKKQEEHGVNKSDVVKVEEIWNNLGLEESKTFLIDYGLNEQELWNNFEVFLKIADLIEDGDELYLDITHSFRSLSLMSYVMLNFISSIQRKNYKVNGIFYGMLEYIWEEKNKDNIAPIINLNVIFELSEWIKAIEAFKNYGRADLITDKIKASDETKELSKVFEHFSRDIAISNMAEIKSFVTRVNKHLELFESAKSPVIRLIAPDIKKFVKRMQAKEKLSDFQLEMAQWYYENKNYALAYIALTESIVTKVCESENIPVDGEDNRKNAKEKYGRIISNYRNCIIM